jgi:hypothetical protein
MEIELILLGVIAIVVVTDLVLSGLKKKSSNDEDVPKTEDQFNEIIKENKFSYILSRKRNIITFVLLVVFIKLVVHYFIYPNQEEFVYYDKEIIHESFTNNELRNPENVFIKDSLGFLEQVPVDSRFSKFGNIIVRNNIFTKNGEEIRQKKVGGSLVIFYYPKEYRSANFATHLHNLFKDELWIFLVSIGAMTVIVFLFNDKIKAR